MILVSPPPIFWEFSQNAFSWSQSQIHLPINGVRKRVAMTWLRALLKDLLQYLSNVTSMKSWGHRSKKVEGACSGVGWPRDTKEKTFFSVQGTLGPIETSAVLSRGDWTERLRDSETERLRDWEAQSSRLRVRERPEFCQRGFWEDPWSPNRDPWSPNRVPWSSNSAVFGSSLEPE